MTKVTGAFTIPVKAAARKTAHGHWVSFLRGNDSQATMRGRLLEADQLIGCNKRYTWRSMEPTLGGYTFAELKSDLAWAVVNNTLISPMIEDKTFPTAANPADNPAPDYLAPYTPITSTSKGPGFVVARWDSFVISRFRALIQHMAQEPIVYQGNTITIDTHPHFAGFMFQETALGNFPNSAPAGFSYEDYTAAKFRDSYINEITLAKNVFLNSNVYFTFNFLQGNQSFIGSVLTTAAANGNTFAGGPDLLPDEPNIRDQVYPFYADFRGQLPLYVHAQTDSYSHLHAGTANFWTMQELFTYARNTLHVDDLFWTYQPGAVVAGGNNWADSVIVIQKLSNRAPFQ